MNSLAVYCLASGAASALISGVVAAVWAKSRSPYSYVLSMATVWVAISTLPLSARTWEMGTFPADPAHFVATMIWVAPFVIGAVLALVWLVATGASRKDIAAASLLASILAAPLSIVSGIYGACSLGDCL